MPSYFPDPWEYIQKSREEEGGREYGTDLFMQGLDINFRRKPWNPREGLLAQREEQEDLPLTPGDPEFSVHDYLIDAQVPSAHAETVMQSAQEQAAAALEKYGDKLDPETREKLLAIAESGQPKDPTKPDWSNPFLNVLDALDAPGELIRMGIADLFADEKAGVEIIGQDYLDAIRGRNEEIRARLGADFIGEDTFLMSGAKLMETLAGPEGVEEFAEGFRKILPFVTPGVAQAIGGTVVDLVLDPYTYGSFGTVGLGKKAAIEGAQAGLTRAGREAVEAVSTNTVRNLSDSASKEMASRITARIESRIDDAVSSRSIIERMTVRDRVTRTVLAEERRALDAAEGIKSVRNHYINDAASATPYVPRGTVIEDTASEVFKELVDKNFKRLADNSPWYSNSRHIPNFAKGGLQIGAPFGRKRFPMLRIPGTETNRAVTLPFRKAAKPLFNRMPDSMQQMFRYLGRRTGVEQASFQLAREGELWRTNVIKNVTDILEEDTFTAEALRPLAHGLKQVYDAGEKAGIDRVEASRLLRGWLGGDTTILDGVPPAVRAAIREAIDGDVERGVDGIRQVFETFHDAARRVGMDIGHEPNYVPLVVTGKFGKLLDGLSAEGVEIPLGRGSSPLSNLGMGILARYVSNTGEGVLGVAGTNPTFSQFAQSNKVARIFRSAVGSIDLESDPNLFALLRSSGAERMSADLANDAIAAALDDLVRLTGMSRRKVLKEGAFHTDLEEIFTAYTTSMGEAVQMGALLRELKRYGLIQSKAKKIDVSNTLTSVTGRLTDETADFVERIAAGEAGVHRASRLETVKVGGRNIKLPAVVIAHPRFAKVAKRLDRVFSRIDSRANEIRGAIEQAERTLIAQGYPEEIARALAMAEGDGDLGIALAEIANLALDEVQTLRTAGFEMAAKQLVDPDTAFKEIETQGRRILTGANEAMAELEEQVRRALNLRPSGAGEVIDVAETTMNGRPMLSVMADEFEKAAEARRGSLAEYVRSRQGERSLSGATPARIAREAADDLADRLTVAEVTVGDLATFSNPATVARVLTEINGRVLQGGYRGVESLTPEMVEAAEEFNVALSLYHEAVSDMYQMRGFSGEVFEEELEAGVRAEGTGIGSLLMEDEEALLRMSRQQVKEAQGVLDAAERKLTTAASGLNTSEESLGELVEHAAETVGAANDAILVGEQWRDVWAVALLKTSKLPRGEYNQAQRELLEKGIEGPTQKELVQTTSEIGPGGIIESTGARSVKGAARQQADTARAFWVHTLASEEEFAMASAQGALYGDRGRPRRALQAMRQGDTDALAAFDPEFRMIVGSITDKHGRPLLDPSRFVWREDGRLVIEPADQNFITLDEVLGDIKQIAARPDLSELEQLRIVKETWEADPQAVRKFSTRLDDFFRQVDAAGGLPQELEDYAYLRQFTGDLKAQVAPQRTMSTADAVKIMHPTQSIDTMLSRPTHSNHVDALIEGGVVDDAPAGQGIKDVGILQPIEIMVKKDGSRVVWAGHHRLAAAHKLGLENVPVRYVNEAGNPIKKLPQPRGPKSTPVDKLIDEAAAVLRRDKGHGPRATKLDKLWDANRENLEKTLPPEAFERLSNLVSSAVASREVARQPFVQQFRSLIGTLEETEEAFVRDVARMRLEGRNVGDEWADSVVEDVLAFRAALERLLRFAPGDQPTGLRGAAENLVDEGGEFDDALTEYRRAGQRIRKDLRQIERKPQLAAFLPELPEGVDDLPRFAKQMADEMLGWRPVTAPIVGKGRVSLEESGIRLKNRIKVEELFDEGELDNLEMTPGTALMLEHIAAASAVVASPLGIRLAAESVREFEKWWKSAATVARPTFVPRNMIGGILNGLLIGVGPNHYAAVGSNIIKFKHAYDATGSFDEALEAVDKNFRPYMEGLWKSKLLSTTFASSIDRLRTPPTLGEYLNPASPQNILFRTGARAMEASEDLLRAAAFVRWYDPSNPASVRMAKEMSLAVHFDYGALTSLETKIKRLVPFFVWTRRNLPLQMRMLIEQPGSVTRLLHAQQNAQDTWGDSTFVDEMGFARSPYLSSFAVETPVLFDGDTPFWQRLMIDPQVPVADLEDAARAFSGDYNSIAEYLLRMVSPVYSTPFESPVGNEELVAAPTGLREIMMFTDWLDQDIENKMSGEQVLANPRLANYFSTALPFFAEWTRTAGLVPSGSGGVTARAGYNIEDGVTLDERLKAAALSLGRAGGATIQTPAETRAAGWQAIFDEITPVIDDLHRTGEVIEPEDIAAYIETLLTREGISFTDQDVDEVIDTVFEQVQPLEPAA